MRTEEVYRKTRETEVSVKVNLEGEGKADIKTGISFLDHMVTSFATHSLIDVTAKVTGDLKHHAVEDLAICVGEAVNKALGTREGLARFGYAAAPMDCSLAFAAVKALALSLRQAVAVDPRRKGVPSSKGVI